MDSIANFCDACSVCQNVSKRSRLAFCSDTRCQLSAVNARVNLWWSLFSEMTAIINRVNLRKTSELRFRMKAERLPHWPTLWLLKLGHVFHYSWVVNETPVCPRSGRRHTLCARVSHEENRIKASIGLRTRCVRCQNKVAANSSLSGSTLSFSVLEAHPHPHTYTNAQLLLVGTTWREQLLHFTDFYNIFSTVPYVTSGRGKKKRPKHIVGFAVNWLTECTMKSVSVWRKQRGQ